MEKNLDLKNNKYSNRFFSKNERYLAMYDDYPNDI